MLYPTTEGVFPVGHSPQLEMEMMSFVRERYSRNYLDGRSDSIDVFYDSIEGTDNIYA